LPQTLTRVFAVDDEHVIATTLATILQHSGFTARSFTKPLEALDAARSEAPDLLISDVMMPQLSGIDLAVQIRQLCPGCRILLFSGQAETRDLLRAAHEEGHDFHVLSKPIHPKDLLHGIRKLDERSNGSAQ
jgi:DNA-binding response OmpR family regulator